MSSRSLELDEMWAGSLPRLSPTSSLRLDYSIFRVETRGNTHGEWAYSRGL